MEVNTPGYKNIEHFYDIIRAENPNGKEELQRDQARKQYILQLEELANERSKALEDPSAGAIDFLNIYRSLIDNIKLKVANFFTSNESKSLTQNNIRLSLHDIMPKILDEKYKSMELLMMRKDELQQQHNSENVDDAQRESIGKEMEEIQKKIDEEVILLYKLSEVKSEQDLSNIMGNKSYSAYGESSTEGKGPKKPSLLSRIFKGKPKQAAPPDLDATGNPIATPEKKGFFSNLKNRFTKKNNQEDANAATDLDATGNSNATPDKKGFFSNLKNRFTRKKNQEDANAATDLDATGNSNATSEKKGFIRNLFKSKPKDAINLQNVAPVAPIAGLTPRAPPPLPPPRVQATVPLDLGQAQAGGNKTRKYRHYIHEIKQNRKELFNKEMEIINSIRNFKHGRHGRHTTNATNVTQNKNMRKRFVTSVKK
jgi:hypothetical protein